MVRKLKYNRMVQKLKFRILAALFTIISLGSCSSSEDLVSRYPYLSQLSNTPCLNSRSSGDESDNDVHATFEIKINGNTAECAFKSLDYPCDFGKVNIEVSYDESIITVLEYPSSDMADCICDVNATFTIENLPKDNFILKIYRCNSSRKYNNDTPTLNEVIDVKNGKVIFPYPSGI